jgi:hypothetical protein
MKYHAVCMLALAWALLYSPEGDGWDVLDEYPTEWSCLSGRTANVDREVQQQIGSALASQPADNPMRQAAYGRAERRVGARYRCSYTKE